jgi:hypothetical protein
MDDIGDSDAGQCCAEVDRVQAAVGGEARERGQGLGLAERVEAPSTYRRSAWSS